MDGGAWWAAVHGVAKSPRLSDFTFTFHFHALEKEMATHSSVLAWRIPGTEEPGRRLSMGSQRVGHDWRDLAAATAAAFFLKELIVLGKEGGIHGRYRWRVGKFKGDDIIFSQEEHSRIYWRTWYLVWILHVWWDLVSICYFREKKKAEELSSKCGNVSISIWWEATLMCLVETYCGR